MRTGRASRTASIVALARAISAMPGDPMPPVVDLIAQELVEKRPATVVKVLSLLNIGSSSIKGVLRLLSLGLIDHVTLRMAAIDQVSESACKQGVDQVVILGAGLDARAHRLGSFADLRIFEVDHPSSQAAKRHQVMARALSSEVIYVPVDFTREHLGTKLAECGHNADAPTLWIWEGVLPYLSAQSMRETLVSLGERSPSGSYLAVTYPDRNDRLWLSRLGPLVERAFQALGEPLLGITTQEEFHAILREEGWGVESDTGPLQWSETYRYGFAPMLWVEERLAFAKRQV